MEVKEVKLIAIDFDTMKPEDVFTWLEQFGFYRYGEKIFIDPKKSDDPRYPSENDNSPIDWYTFLQVPSQYYDETMFIIRKSDFERIKMAFQNSKVKETEQ